MSKLPNEPSLTDVSPEPESVDSLDDLVDAEVADALTDESDQSETEGPDATDTQDPKRFADEGGFAKFVAGVRPNRRAIRLYSRSDLNAMRDLLRAQIAEAVDTGNLSEQKRLRRDLKRTTQQMSEESAVMDVVVEARSQSWIERAQKALVAKGITRPEDQDPHIVAAQIVQPKGVTAEMLVNLRDVSESQWGQLIMAAAEANTTAGPVMPDFSRRPSIIRPE